MADNCIYKIDSITVDGSVLAIEEGSATLMNATGVEREGKPSASGPDFYITKQVERSIKAKVQFGTGVDPVSLNVTNAQIVLTNVHTNRRARCTGCATKSVGEIGNGAVDVEYIITEQIQWL